MKLIRCHIENFGGLSGYDLAFRDGLTVVEAPNGFGKTTLAEFLRAMLYGFPRAGKDLRRNRRRRYSPWQGGRYGGSLTFEQGGERYRVERFFGDTPKQDTFALYRGEEGVPCADFSENLGEELFRLDADSFLRSVYLSQEGEAGPLSTDAIRARLTRLVEDTDDVNNFERAMEALRRRRSALMPYRGQGGSVGRAQADITRLQAELDALSPVPGAAAAARERAAELEAELARGREELAALRGAAGGGRAALAERYRELVRRREETEAALKQLEARYPGGLPDEAGAEELCSLTERAELLSAPEPATRAEEEARRVLRETEARFPGGLPGPEALAEARGLWDRYREEEALRRQCRLSPEETARLDELEGRLAGGREGPARGRGPFWAALALAVLLAGAGCALLALSRPLPGGVLIGLGGLALLAALLLRPRKAGRRTAEEAALRGELRALLDRRAGLESRAAAAEEELEVLSRQLMERLEPYDGAVPDDFGAALEELTRAAETRRRAEETLSALAERRARREEERAACVRRTEELARALGLGHPPAGREEARALREGAARAARLRERLEEEARAGEDFRNAHPELFAPGGGDPLAGEEADLTRRLDGLASALAETRAEAERLERRGEALPGLKDDLARRREERDRDEADCRLLDRTMELLTQAREELSRSYLGPIREGFARYLERLTGRREEAVFLSGELTVRLERRGEARELDCFSAGQADLILFCLRLALVDALFSGERTFLVLDDPFADLDDARLSAALALLRELGEERQILYLTCASARAPERRVESRE